MKHRYMVLGITAGTVAIAASSLAYGVFRKPESSKELFAKAALVMRNVKSFDIDGTMDAEASLGSHLSLPADVTFDGNYNVADSTGQINYTVKTKFFGLDYDYSDQIELSDKNEDSSATEAVTYTTEDTDTKDDSDTMKGTVTTDDSDITEHTEAEESSGVSLGESLNLLEHSQFKYDKQKKTYSVTFKMEDIIALEPVEEMLLGEGSTLKQIGITEEQFYNALNDDARVELTFNHKYYLFEISISSMDIEKDINLEGIGLGSIPAKASFETDIHIKSV